MAYYLLLEFKDAGLVLNNKNSRPNGGWKHALNEFGVNSNVPARNIDYDTPVGVSQVSNMLHVMFGLAPKPTYRKSFIERNDKIYEIAKKARIWYAESCDEYIYEKAEVLSTAKYQTNAHKTPKTKIGDEVYDGVYSWSYLFKWLNKRANEDLINDFFSLLNSVLGCDDITKSYTFEKAVLALRSHYDDEKMVKFYEDYEIKKYIGSHFSYMLFGKPIVNGKITTGNNTTFKSPTPLLENRSVSQRIARLSGEILVEIDDEELAERLHQFGTLPTLLDGGIVTVVSMEKWKPDPIDYEKFKEISEQKIPEDSENQKVA